MKINSDPEVVQRWQTQNRIGNFEADLSMMVSRPYDANLVCKNPKLHFFKISENVFDRNFVSAGSRPDSCRSRELNRRPGEGQGGPNKGQLDPTIGQNLQRKKLYKSRTLVYRALDSYMDGYRTYLS